MNLFNFKYNTYLTWQSGEITLLNRDNVMTQTEQIYFCSTFSFQPFYIFWGALLKEFYL